ncbi:hypothetical protein AYK20_00195 [Thermoplasmatales archaeon SG8-52-1]|jgi:DNA-binding Lrp family transcriptional regulator|nr:MAG: hypothetical protein AYK20_00195 [Thermoplasmatales archaeon SG8-52-1]
MSIYKVHIISGEYELLIKLIGISLEDIVKLLVDKPTKLDDVNKILIYACFKTVKEKFLKKRFSRLSYIM